MQKACVTLHAHAAHSHVHGTHAIHSIVTSTCSSTVASACASTSASSCWCQFWVCRPCSLHGQQNCGIRLEACDNRESLGDVNDKLKTKHLQRITWCRSPAVPMEHKISWKDPKGQEERWAGGMVHVPGTDCMLLSSRNSCCGSQDWGTPSLVVCLFSWGHRHHLRCSLPLRGKFTIYHVLCQADIYLSWYTEGSVFCLKLQYWVMGSDINHAWIVLIPAVHCLSIVDLNLRPSENILWCPLQDPSMQRLVSSRCPPANWGPINKIPSNIRFKVWTSYNICCTDLLQNHNR